MADQIKFTDTELQSLTELQTTYNNIVNNLGQTEIQLTDSEKNLEGLRDTKLQLLQAYDTAKQSESALFAKINEKYGPGNLDIETGIFTPTEGALVDAKIIEVEPTDNEVKAPKLKPVDEKPVPTK